MILNYMNFINCLLPRYSGLCRKIISVCRLMICIKILIAFPGDLNRLPLCILSKCCWLILGVIGLLHVIYTALNHLADFPIRILLHWFITMIYCASVMWSKHPTVLTRALDRVWEVRKVGYYILWELEAVCFVE